MGRKLRRYTQGKFQKGHKYFRPYSRSSVDNTDPSVDNDDGPTTVGEWMPRQNKETFAKVVKVSPNGIFTTPNSDGKAGNVKILRPCPIEEADKCQEYAGHLEDEGGMRLYDRQRMFQMWNTCIRQHASDMNDRCTIPTFDLLKEMKKGNCWKLSTKCTSCKWESQIFKLYEEVMSNSRGPKTAAPNLAQQVGLQDSPIGNTKIRSILASTNTPPPSRSGMQKLSNKVSTAISNLNERDMQERRAEAKEINKLRGFPEDSSINVAMDVRYNSSTFGSRHKMGQNASQAIGTCIEGQTDIAQIIGVHLENKLCWMGARLRNRGFDVKCPGGHEHCTATVPAVDTLSEYEIGRKIGKQIAPQIMVKHITTDGDARSAEGMQEAMKAVNPAWRVSRLADTTHLGQGQFRNVMKAKFSEGMFPGSTQEVKREEQKMFALDVKYRCHKIFSMMHRNMAGDIGQITVKMPYVIDSTVECYAGSCKLCSRKSLECSGRKRKNWWANSMYLNAVGLTQSNINMTGEDKVLLRALIEFTLGRESLKLTKFNSNTNKNEAVNRAISASLPKNVNFSRNAKGRVHSAVHRINHGAGTSMLRKLEAIGSPVSKGGFVARAIRQLQRSTRYYQEYQKRKEVRQRRVKIKSNQIHAYFRAKRQKKDQYRKGQLDPKLACRASKHDHSYARKTQVSDHSYAKVN